MRSAPPSTSPLDRALSRVGDRWSLLVVDALLSGPQRFADLQDAIPGIATNILTQRLRHLEAEQLVVATPYSHRPVRYSYELTEAGRGLAGPLRLLAQWGSDEGDGSSVHGVCGTVLEAAWWCPTCERRVEGDPAEEHWI